MNRKSAIPFVSVVVGVAMAASACTGGVEHVPGAAAPISGSPVPSVTTAPATTPASSASPQPSSSHSASPKPSDSSPPKVLGPFGLGALKLGMTRKQAEATGLINRFIDSEPSSADCTLRSTLKGAPIDAGTVLSSTTLGVEVIDGYGSIRTPEGIRVGSTLAAVKRAYPEWQDASDSGDDANGRGYGNASGNSKAVYRIELVKGKVVGLTLQNKHQNCYE
jgi:hypothetical protein